MEISNTSHIITFISSGEDNYYNTVIFDPGMDIHGKVLEKFIEDYKKQNPEYVKQTVRRALGTKCYKPRELRKTFDEFYEVVK